MEQHTTEIKTKNLAEVIARAKRDEGWPDVKVEKKDDDTYTVVAKKPE